MSHYGTDAAGDRQKRTGKSPPKRDLARAVRRSDVDFGLPDKKRRLTAKDLSAAKILTVGVLGNVD